MPTTRPNIFKLLNFRAYLFLLVACGADKIGGDEISNADSDADTGSAFVPEDIPPPNDWFSGTEILDAVATDALTEGEAALALLHIMSDGAQWYMSLTRISDDP
jgi:hypothetical protein